MRLAPWLLAAAAGWSAAAQDFADLEKKVTEFTLANGMRFLVVERHNAPSVSFVTHVAAGTANDPAGATGLARLFEHLAFSGTETIGTRDWAAEKKAMEAVERALDRLEAERAKGRQANDVKLLSLQYEAASAISAARNLATANEFQRILDDNGASGATAAVSADSSQFRITLPSNRTELWFLLESERLSRPVFRDFYKERDAAAMEHRSTVETNSELKILQTLAAAAFAAHPYRNPAYGWPSDAGKLRLSDAREFFERHYAPGNLTIAIAGDIRPEEARRLAERYFGPIPARSSPPPIRTEEPPQTGLRTVVIENAKEPLVAVGFKRPDEYDRDDAVLDVARMILTAGRSSLLARELTETRRCAATIHAIASFPGARSPHLFAIVAAAAPGHTAEENEKGIAAALARLGAEELDEATVERGRRQARAQLARQLSDNASMASALATFASDYGDFRALFRTAGAYNKVTARQVQLAAARYLIPARQTSVQMVPPAPVRAASAEGVPTEVDVAAATRPLADARGSVSAAGQSRNRYRDGAESRPGRDLNGAGR